MANAPAIGRVLFVKSNDRVDRLHYLELCFGLWFAFHFRLRRNKPGKGYFTTGTRGKPAKTAKKPRPAEPDLTSRNSPGCGLTEL